MVITWHKLHQNMLPSILTLLTDVVLKHEDSGAKRINWDKDFFFFWEGKIGQQGEYRVIYHLCSNTTNQSNMCSSLEDSWLPRELKSRWLCFLSRNVHVSMNLEIVGRQKRILEATRKQDKIPEWRRALQKSSGHLYYHHLGWRD